MFSNKRSRNANYDEWAFFISDVLYEALPVYKHGVVTNSSIKLCTHKIASAVASERKYRGLGGVAIQPRSPKHKIANWIGSMVGFVIGGTVLLLLNILDELTKPRKKTHRRKRQTSRRGRAR